MGGVAGIGVGYFALATLGVEGLSAAGITSGLATAGGLIGGSMVAGIGVIAAPAVILGGAGYLLVRSRNKKKLKEKKEFYLQQFMMRINKLKDEIKATVKHNASRLKALEILLYTAQGAKSTLENDLSLS